MADNSFLPPHGNYSELLSYKKAEIVYETYREFCETRPAEVVANIAIFYPRSAI
jgi:hypothetical protein